MARYRTKIKPKPKKSLFPLWLALIGLGLIIVSGWVILSSRPQVKASIEVKGAPRLKVDQDTINRGDVKLGTPVRDDIRVTNIGDQPLRFTAAPYIEVLEGC